ncbi:MAG: hypothetical protein IJ318_01365 [Clostridia bacterium]|nr:hypothetical protein [Clostridia bacterium]
MKKFLMYVIIVITCLFLGFTVYYLTKNNETIYLTLNKDEAIYKNVGESLWLDNLIEWTKPYKDTTLKITSGDTKVVSYDENTKRFDCIGGGFTTITIAPSNTNFGPFIFEIYVGNGTTDSPFVISTAEDLALIGNDPELKFNLNNSYILTCDLDLKTFNSGVWTPLGAFTGNFDGNGNTLYNLNLTSTSNAGLFSSVENGAVVENVKFAKATVNGAFDNVGLVAGVNRGTIGKCEVLSATITNTSATGNTGAIAGSNLYDITTAMVNMCSATANFEIAGNAGGLVGFNKSSIVLNSRSIVNSVNLTATTATFGGLVGINESTYVSADTTYYASAIKNSYVVVNTLSGQSATFGAVVGNNKEETYTGQMFYNTYVGTLYCLNSGVSGSAVGAGSNLLSSDASSNLQLVSRDALKESATYNGYNFDNVWLLNTADIANINYAGSYETYKIIAIGKELTQNEVGLLDFLTSVKASPATISTTYRVTANLTVDVHSETGSYNWTTIAPNESAPMLASIIVDPGVTCVIKNFTLSGANSSFFGHISGNTVVSGITFENVSVDSCTAETSGIVATKLINGATLENIKVKNFARVTTNAREAGIICGRNGGSIINCSVENSAQATLTVQTSDNLLSVGGIVGYNAGYISGCSVNNVKLTLDTTVNANGSVNFGGVAGTTESNIANSKVQTFVCDTTATGTIYAGGVVGYVVTSSAVISKCYSYMNVKIGLGNTSSYLAGIAGYLSSGASVKGCFYNVNELNAYNVGGLVGVNYGTVYSSYVGDSAKLTGNFVGGLVNLSHGTTTDCYTLAKLTGVGNDSVLCGFTYIMYAENYIEHCFSNVTFSGSGKYYAETKTEFRTNALAQFINGIANNKVEAGTTKNNIVIANNGAHIQQSSALLNQHAGWIDASYEQCTGESGNYSVFKDTAGFDVNIWNFDNVGSFPTLKDVATA